MLTRQHIPSTITLTAMALGISALLLILESQSLVVASLLLIAAAGLDFFDGFVARSLNATSEFGRIMDSLSDLICFGLVPALIGFTLAKGIFQDIAWFTTLFYTLCAAVRLAHYSSTESSEYFSGLPSPAAALWVISGCHFHPVLGLCATFAAAILMVSSIPHPGPKAFLSHPPVILVLIAAAAIGLAFAGFWWHSLFLATTCYIAIAVKACFDDRI